MFMRQDGVVDEVWVKFQGLCNTILTTFQRCLGKYIYLGVVFGYFGALMRASGVTYVWRGFPKCGGDGMEWPIGSG